MTTERSKSVKQWVRFPPPPRAGETRLQYERRALNRWRMAEKERLLRERGTICERCKARTVSDLDEGICTRGDMRGLSLEQRQLAFCNINLFLLCRICNRERAHQREWAFEQSCSRYGEQAVREWYGSLGLRAPDLRFVPKF